MHGGYGQVNKVHNTNGKQYQGENATTLKTTISTFVTHVISTIKRGPLRLAECSISSDQSTINQ